MAFQGNIVVDGQDMDVDLYGSGSSDTTTYTTHCMIDGAFDAISFKYQNNGNTQSVKITLTVLEVERQSEPCCTVVTGGGGE